MEEPLTTLNFRLALLRKALPLLTAEERRPLGKKAKEESYFWIAQASRS